MSGPTPIETLFSLNEATRQLDMVQSWIISQRITAGTDQQRQLELDRRQTSVDEKRARIEFMKLAIASQN